MEHKIKVDEKSHALDGQNKMNIFRKEKKHCDFIIKVESEEIAVHRAVICSRSDYFDAMFSHDTKEKRTGVAEIKGVDRECTVKCVDFMYTGETSIKGEKCGELMHVATLFQLLTLCNAITAFLEESLECKSFFATKQLADFYNCQKLMNACNDFALKHFQDIALLEEFKQLEKEYIEFLLGPSNTVAGESVKCKAAIEWVKHDTANRKSALLGLIGKLDFTKMPLAFRGFLMEQEPLVHSSTECLRLIGMSFLKTMNVTSSDTTSYQTYDSIRKRGIAVFDKTFGRMQILDMKGKTWSQTQACNDYMANSDFSAVVLAKHLYIFLKNKNVYRIVHSDPYSTWEKMASKNFDYGPVVVLYGMIYSLDFFNWSNTMERFDPCLNKWQILPKKKTCVHGAAVAVVEGKVFSIGGYSGIFHAEVEKFDPTTSSWSLDSHLKKARSNSSAVTVENGIYVLGGYDGIGKMTSDIEYRCPRRKTWITITPMKTPRQSLGSCCIEKKIYAIGGDSSTTKTIEEYDPELNEWKIVCQLDGKGILPLSSVALPY